MKKFYVVFAEKKIQELIQKIMFAMKFIMRKQVKTINAYQ